MSTSAASLVPAASRRTPAHAARPPRSRLAKPSVRAAWAWENRKARNWWYWPALALLCAGGMAIGRATYLEYSDTFRDQGASWLAVWGQGSILTSMLAFPLLVGAVIAQASASEHQGRNWRRMAANRLQNTMLMGKLLYMTQTALLTALVFVAEFAVTGLLLGFDPAGLGPYVVRIIPITLAILAIELFVAWLGVVMTSFASIMSTALIATLSGCAAMFVMPPLARFYLMSLITAACASRDLDSMDSMSSIALISVICAVWILVWTAALRRSAARVA